MRLTRAALLLFAITGFAFSARGLENASEPEIQKLATASAFVLGPVGSEEKVTASETTFRELCKKEFAEAYFVELFQRGTAEGKCYALVGLRELSPEFYAKYAEAFRKTAPQYVRVISGRFLGQALTTDVLAEIDAKRFTAFVKSEPVKL